MLVLVLVLVLDTQRLKSFEDEHEDEDEDETANELIETALILRSLFSDHTGRCLARSSARVKHKMTNDD